ncbi:MAG: PEP-CTERM sorting domain-containing protein [Verrucomicrobiota bacterium]
MKSPRLLLAAALCAGLSITALPARAVVFGFDTDAEFDDNFVKLGASGTSTIATFTFASSERAVRKTGTGTQSVLFDTGATGGSGGSGGTSGDGADLFADVDLSADIRISAFNTPSFGLWSRVNADASSGYLGLVNIINATSVQLRIFDSNSNPGANGVGTVLVNETLSTGSFTLDTSTFYTVSFTTSTVSPSEVAFELSLSSVGGATIVSTTATDTTTPVTGAGQVGFRAASSTLYVDNFGVASSAIPEPGSAGLIIGVAVFGLIATRRRRT